MDFDGFDGFSWIFMDFVHCPVCDYLTSVWIWGRRTGRNSCLSFQSMTLLGVGGPDGFGNRVPAEPSLRAINQHAPALTKSSSLAKSK